VWLLLRVYQIINHPYPMAVNTFMMHLVGIVTFFRLALLLFDPACHLIETALQLICTDDFVHGAYFDRESLVTILFMIFSAYGASTTIKKCVFIVYIVLGL